MDKAVLFSMALQLGEQLRPEGVNVLAPEAEYTLRELISIAKKFMRHGKRNHLIPNDITLATKFFDAMFLRRSRSERNRIPNGNARYPVSNEKKLMDLFKGPLPRTLPEVSLESAWLEGKTSEHEGSSVIALAHEAKQSSSSSSHQNGSITPPQEDAKVTQISLGDAVKELITLVNTHVTPAGQPEVLIATTHAIASFLTLDSYETEKYRDDLLRCALTCIIGNYPKLNLSDAWQARQRVILALARWKHETTDTIAVGRVCQTLFAAILDPEIPINPLCGGITTIIAFGEATYSSYLAPHVPALLHSLEKRLGEAISSSEEDTRQAFERLCQILSNTIEALVPAP